MSSGLRSLIAVAVVAAIAFAIGHKRGFNAAIADAEAKVDTLLVTDTVRLEKPVPVHIWHKDTLMVPVLDTIRVPDTAYLAVEREYKVYEDSLYRAVVSGYRPSLDEIDIYRRDKIVTVTTTVVKEQPKWGFGVGIGPGLMLDTQGRIRAGAAVVVGIEWRF